MKNNVLLAAFLGCAAAVSAQQPQRMQFTIEGTANDTIYLANYFGNKLYYADTTVANAKGVAVFNKAAGYKAGVYAVVVPGPKYFEFLAGETVVELKSDTAALNEHLTV